MAINWANFDRYWKGQITDNEDLKARWAEIIPLYDFEYDPVASAATKTQQAGTYRFDFTASMDILGKQVSFAKNGNVNATGVFIFEVKSGKITLLGDTTSLLK